MAVTCPICSASMHRREVIAGWCENCGENLPPSRGMPSSERLAATLWITPVLMQQWPTIRWMVQIIAGLFLAVFFGGMVGLLIFLPKTGSERFVFTWFFGVPVGLPLAAAMNGLLVGMRGRRLTFLAVLAVVAASTAFSFLLYAVSALLH